MIAKPITITGGLLIAVAVFIATAIIDAMITVYVFKKWGGCPMNQKPKKEAVC